MTLERITQRFKLFAQFGEVVNLTIEAEDITLVPRSHRLMAGGGQIENGQTSVSEPKTYRLIQPDARIVRASVPQYIRHAPDNTAEVRDIRTIQRLPNA